MCKETCAKVIYTTKYWNSNFEISDDEYFCCECFDASGVPGGYNGDQYGFALYYNNVNNGMT